MTARWFARAGLVAGVCLAVLALVAAAYVGWLMLSTRTQVAALSGTRTGLAVDRPATIARDARGVAHIRAATDHDLFFAEGYAMAADRLFQMDMTRRFVHGRLSEVLGRATLRTDRRMRVYGIRDLAARVFAGSSREERMMLTAFADGINAAATHEPTPPEYRALFTRFEPWQPADSLAVGFATLLDLDDTAAADPAARSDLSPARPSRDRCVLPGERSAVRRPLGQPSVRAIIAAAAGR